MTATEIINIIRSSKQDFSYTDRSENAQRIANTLMNGESVVFAFKVYTAMDYHMHVITNKCRVIHSIATHLDNDYQYQPLKIYNLLEFYNKEAGDFEKKEFKVYKKKDSHGKEIPDETTESFTIGEWGATFPYGKYESKGFFRTTYTLIETYGMPQKVYNAALKVVKDYYGNQPAEPIVKASAKIAVPEPTGEDITEKLIKYKKLLDTGVITKEEFDVLKAKLINA